MKYICGPNVCFNSRLILNGMSTCNASAIHIYRNISLMYQHSWKSEQTEVHISLLSPSKKDKKAQMQIG